MDILHLVDRLEEVFNEGRSIWFTRQVAVDEDRMLDLIDQMRISIPEEIKKAQQITAQRDRMLAQAQEEANRTVQQARERAQQMIERDDVTKEARVQAEQILTAAREEAEVTRREADAYVLKSLTDMEMELERLLTQVRNGIHTIKETQNPTNEA